MGTPTTDVWLEQDFARLKEKNIRGQLESIFGEHEAEQYLNPSIKDKRIQNIPVHISTKDGPLGAHALWQSLRARSEHKLSALNYECARRHNVVSAPPSRLTAAARKLREYERRLQLMHRVAQINQGHAQSLTKKIDFPHISGNWDIDGVDVGSDGKGEIIVLPDICNEVAPTVASKFSSAPHNYKTSTKKRDVVLDEKPCVVEFLHDEEAVSNGGFRKRMIRSRGVDASVGIANASHSYQHDQKLLSNIKTSEEGLKMRMKKQPFSSSGKTDKQWEPLTLNSLMQGADKFLKNRQSVI